MARRSAATACFSASRCWRVRVSIALGKWEIFGRFAPIFRSLGLAYGSIDHLTIWRFSGLANANRQLARVDSSESSRGRNGAKIFVASLVVVVYPRALPKKDPNAEIYSCRDR